MKLAIKHTYYGCDSGCCGHMVEVQDGDPRRFDFQFYHAGGTTPSDLREFAVEIVGEENIGDVDFAASDIRDYSTC